jgi:hypothetical protein
MTLQPAASATPDETGKPAEDRSLMARRVLVWVLSFVIGAVVTALCQIFLLRVGLDVTFPLSSWEVNLLLFATIPMGFFILIWLDYFMGTRILPD